MTNLSPSDSFRFRPQQIVSLIHQDSCLYAEVVQEIPDRKMCWVRPLFLVVDAHLISPPVYDLRLASDLVWPMQAFSPALDVEVIPFLSKLETQTEETPENIKTARSRLNQFIKQVWQEKQKFMG